jgi:hypothetical protein
MMYREETSVLGEELRRRFQPRRVERQVVFIENVVGTFNFLSTSEEVPQSLCEV